MDKWKDSLAQHLEFAKSINLLTINGTSSNVFDFPILVIKNDGFKLPVQKNIYTTSPYINGEIKQTIEAYEPIEKAYTLYCPTADLLEMRRVKMWIGREGTLNSSEDPQIFYEFYDVQMSDAEISSYGGYQIDVVFRCHPFGYELNQYTTSFKNGASIANYTNTYMTPLITVNGNIGAEKQPLTIGEQTVYLKNVVEKLYIECKDGKQNVYNKDHQLANDCMTGDFFRVQTGVNKIELGDGIDSIDILTRWCWV